MNVIGSGRNLVRVSLEKASREVSDVNFAASGLFDFIVHHLTDKNVVVPALVVSSKRAVETVVEVKDTFAGRVN